MLFIFVQCLDDSEISQVSSFFLLLFPDNASAPFEAVVEILGQKYGRGEASSKRLAKAEAGQLNRMLVFGHIHLPVLGQLPTR